jgi:hypothetical protein
MTPIRVEAEMRQRLVREVERLEEELRIIYEQISVLRGRRRGLERQIIPYEARLRQRSEIEEGITFKEDEADELRELLAIAVHELEDYDETREIIRASRCMRGDVEY